MATPNPEKALRLAQKKKNRETMANLDTIQARLNIQQSENHKLVSTWYKPPADWGIEESEEEKDELPANAGPPRVGLGADIPSALQGKGSMEMLKRTLQGKRARPDVDDRREPKKARGNFGPTKKEESSDEEDVGRSALGKSKKVVVLQVKKEVKEEEDSDDDEPARGAKKGPSKPKTTSTSFFDLHKAGKKKKSKKNKAEKSE